MISERCGCGAKFLAEHSQEVKLWREWRDSHTCAELAEPFRETSASAQVESSGQLHEPELQIGFRPNYFDDDEDRSRRFINK